MICDFCVDITWHIWDNFTIWTSKRPFEGRRVWISGFKLKQLFNEGETPILGPTCTWDHMAKETQKHKYQFDKIDFPSQGLSSTIAAFLPDGKNPTSLAQGVPSLSHHPVVQLNMQTQNPDTSSWTNQIKSHKSFQNSDLLNQSRKRKQLLFLAMF